MVKIFKEEGLSDAELSSFFSEEASSDFLDSGSSDRIIAVSENERWCILLLWGALVGLGLYEPRYDSG